MTSDEHAPYKTAIEHAYAVDAKQPDGMIQREMPKDFCYATVCKKRKGGRVIEIVQTLVFGAWSFLLMFLFRSTVSNTINTSFVERHNSTDRNQNARK